MQGEPDGKKKKPVPGVVEGGEAAWRIAFSFGQIVLEYSTILRKVSKVKMPLAREGLQINVVPCSPC